MNTKSFEVIQGFTSPQGRKLKEHGPIRIIVFNIKTVKISINNIPMTSNTLKNHAKVQSRTFQSYSLYIF